MQLILFTILSCAYAQHELLDDLIDGASTYEYDHLGETSPEEMHAIMIVWGSIIAMIGAVWLAAMTVHGAIDLGGVDGQPDLLASFAAPSKVAYPDSDDDECLCC